MKNKKYIYSPWRLDYILSEKEKGCILCHKPDANEDEKHFIVYRSKLSYVMLNLYPYNNGHVMVVPFRHVSSLTDLDPGELQDLFEVVQLTEKVLRNAYHPEGINIGLNLGKAAGAGIDEHLHVHLVPRWSGDCNFMSVIGGIRVIPEAFERTYNLLQEQFDNERTRK
ncbi:MAG TPA: HIT domain-containing protein [Candidatus Cloacimonadota bacterium]|nr:HIT domain-containing protein [Candidatus Cloacimonadota bacterium]HPT71517.1 HIT domain-containing protein [Candidatus Cloacimonadota bacterium]